MKQIIGLTILFIFLILSSCSRDEKKQKEIKTEVQHGKYCDNQLRLICAGDSIPLLDLNLHLSYDSFESYIDDIFDGNICDKIKYYSIPFDLESKSIKYGKDSILIRIRFHKTCHEVLIISRSVTEIRINQHEDILFEGEYSSIDSLKDELYFYHLNALNKRADFLKRSYISVQWDQNVSSEVIGQILNSIIESYFFTAEVYSNEVYGMDICDLDKENILQVENQIPFNLELQFNKYEHNSFPKMKALTNK